MYVQSAEMKKTFEEALKHEKERFQVIMSVTKYPIPLAVVVLALVPIT